MTAGLVTALLAAIPAPPGPPGPSAPGREPRARPGRPRVWRIPAVLFAIALISVTFFGDGALESFLSSYLQRTLAGGVLLSGIGIGSYHFASLLGRLTATAALRRFGERRVVTAAGLLAATGLLTAVMAPDAAGAIGGLLLVGFAIAPVVPTALSLAGRSAPGRSGQAVATTTAAGYGSFILSPLTIGLLAQATSLRLALGLLVLPPGRRGPSDPVARLRARLSAERGRGGGEVASGGGLPAPRQLARPRRTPGQEGGSRGRQPEDAPARHVSTGAGSPLRSPAAASPCPTGRRPGAAGRSAPW